MYKIQNISTSVIDSYEYEDHSTTPILVKSIKSHGTTINNTTQLKVGTFLHIYLRQIDIFHNAYLSAIKNSHSQL